MQSTLKKSAGALLIVLGLIALLTPLTPGSWIIFIGSVLLGLELVFARRTARFLTDQKDWFVPLACIAAPFVAAAVGGAFTASAISSWYAELAKPAWTPPAYLFGPVWTLLYLLMGIAALLVFRAGKPGRGLALTVFFAHLVVNALWSVVFFGLHAVGIALAIILMLWAMILWLIFLFRRESKTAAWLLAPYLVWVAYATTLNAGILLLN